MAEAHAVFAIQHIAQAHLPQIVAPLLVMSPLRQLIARIGAGHVSIEVGRVVGQQATADQLLLTPQAEQADLRLFQLLLGNRVEAVPELLRGEALGRKAPVRTQDGAVIPTANFGIRPELADAVDGGQQQIVCGRGAGAGRDWSSSKTPVRWAASQSEPGKPNSRAVASKGSGAVRSLTNAATFWALPRYAW